MTNDDELLINKLSLRQHDIATPSTLGSGLAKSVIWIGKTYKNTKTNKNADKNLNDYVLTCQNIKKQALIAAEEVQKEYCIALYPQIEAGLKYRFATVLMDLILQYIIDFSYTPDFSKQVSEKRAMQKKFSPFWQHQDTSTNRIGKEDKEALQQRTKYEVRLNKFFSSFFANSEKVMSDENIKLRLIMDSGVLRYKQLNQRAQ